MTNLRGKSVLIVGGLGFIGVNLTTRLAVLGARVAVLTPDRARHADRTTAFEQAGVEIIEGDLRDQPLIEKHVAGRHLVINLSGQSGPCAAWKIHGRIPT